MRLGVGPRVRVRGLQGAGVRIFEVLVMAVLRLLARLGPARGALCGLALGALAQRSRT